MRLKGKYLESIIVTIIILAMIIGASGIAISQSTGVSVTRLINESSADTAQYLPGDNFTVRLNYVVTGTQYAVSIRETLPAGWSIVDSNMHYSHYSATNTYTWNISSLLSGVSSGTILYLVKIPYDATTDDIIGSSEWYSSLSDIADGNIPGSNTTTTSNIKIDIEENNGPAIWISTPTEEIGDGDGHLECGEWATYHFFINDSDGIQSYRLLVNGNECNNNSTDVNLPGYIAGTAHAQVTQRLDPNDLENVFSIEATDNDGIGNVFSLPVYVPNYDYTAWTKGEWNGWSTQAASFEPNSSLTDGGWIVLQGGNPIKLPALGTHYSGPQTINKAKLTSISNIPILGWLGISGFSGDAGATVNVTPRTDVQVPMSTYPIYSEYNGANVASATFYGTPEMNGGQRFHVVLVNTSKLASAVDLADIDNAIDQADIYTNATGDFPITSDNLPGLNGLKEGYYALLVLDYRLPNTPCLVSMAPIIVTKSGMTADKVSPVQPMPGDQILYTLNMVGSTTPGAEYMYLAAMVPENNYSAALNITSDGTGSGTTFSLNGFTLKEDITVSPDGSTITIKGIKGTYTFDSSDMGDISALQDMLVSEFGASNVSMTNSSVTSSTSGVDLVLKTKPTMPTGRYVVLSLAIDNSTGSIAAFNQTYVDLGQSTYTYNLVKDWNLISIPLTLQDNSISAIIPTNVRNNIVNIWAWDESVQNWMYYSPNPDPWFASHYPPLTSINIGHGYWVELPEG